MRHDELDWRKDAEPARLVALSDGVFAVAMTLAAVDIASPEIAKRLLQEGARAVVLDLAPKFLAIAATFLLVGLYWVSHHRLFDRVERVDRKLLVLNLVFLLAVTLMPFATLLSGQPDSDVFAAVAYAAYLAALGLLLFATWTYARRAGLLEKGLDPRVARYNSYRALTAAGVFALSCVVILVAGARWGRLCWFGVLLHSRLAARLVAAR